MKISLLGYMGSGKSTVGKNLAIELGLIYYDLDLEIEKQTNSSISDLIMNKGELFFRKLERKVLEEILSKDNFVLSTGGGTPCYYDNIDLINQKSTSVYFQYGVNEIFERLEGNQKQRPLIAHLKGMALKEYIGKHLLERSSFYEKSNIIIPGAGKSKEEIIKQIRDTIHE